MKVSIKTLFAAITLSATLTFHSCEVLNSLPVGGVNGLPGTGGINGAEAAGGLKQALNQGLEKSIQQLAVRDGYFGNAAVKILMPPEAQQLEKTLRGLGMNRLVDDLILNLNRAAETAVKEAAPVFVSSLSELTIQDAFNILLSGQNDAATQYFKRTTTDQLIEKFQPIVNKAIGEHQVARHWNTVISTYNQLPLAQSKVEADLNKYVTDKAIEGLFLMVAKEESNIRANLAGTRSTPLLQKVFKYADAHGASSR